MTTFRLKPITFLGRTVPIIMQNENGPCPLLAISNILLLRGNISIHTDYSSISCDELITMVGDFMMETVNRSSAIRASEELRLNQEKNIADAIAMLPKMKDGLDVNVKFDDIFSFEFTPECIIFDLLDINLVHGWVVEPEEKEFAPIASLSYNQLVEKIIAMNSLKPTKPDINSESASKSDTSASNATTNTTTSETNTPSDGEKTNTEEVKSDDKGPTKDEGTTTAETITTETVTTETTTETTNTIITTTTTTAEVSTATGTPPEPQQTDEKTAKIIHEGERAAHFLEVTASQMTFHGLTEIHRKVKERQLCVFFRNNHFSTLFKLEGLVYLLVTDLGYLQEPVVWENFCEIDGDIMFTTAEFKRYDPLADHHHVDTAPLIGEHSDFKVDNGFLQEQYRIEQQILQQRQGTQTAPAPIVAPVQPVQQQPVHYPAPVPTTTTVSQKPQELDGDYLMALQLSQELNGAPVYEVDQPPEQPPMRSSGKTPAQQHAHPAKPAKEPKKKKDDSCIIS